MDNCHANLWVKAAPQHQFSEETGVILFSQCLCSHLEGLGEEAVLSTTCQWATRCDFTWSLHHKMAPMRLAPQPTHAQPTAGPDSLNESETSRMAACSSRDFDFGLKSPPIQSSSDWWVLAVVSLLFSVLLEYLWGFFFSCF